MREFVEIAFERAGLDRSDHVAIDPRLPAAGGGRPSRRRRVEGARRARLGAAHELPGARRADGRRRPRAPLVCRIRAVAAEGPAGGGRNDHSRFGRR